MPTLSLVDQGPPEPCPSAFNLAAYALWDNGASVDKIALVVMSPTGAKRLSYGMLRSRVQSVAGGLLARGLFNGDRVLLRLGNTEVFPIAFLAAAYAGLVPVPTSAALTVDEVTRLAEKVSPGLIISDGSTVLPEGFAPVTRLDELQGNAGLPDLGDPNRPGFIVFTSGTSGSPMGVVHAHRAIWARRAMRADWYDLSPDDRVMHAGAFNWTYTLGTGLLDPWSMGATALVLGPDVTTEQFPLLANRYEATILAGAPGIFRRLLRVPNLGSLPRLRHALSAGEKLPEGVRDAWHRITGTHVHEAFGQSEISTFLSGSPARPAPPKTLGYVQRGRRVAIIGPGGPVPRGVSGDIAVDAGEPGLMIGYLDDPDATNARRSGPWFLTGDTGTMEDDGAIRYDGRRDDILTAGGFRVSPIEVEAAMERFDQIHDCAAVDLSLNADTTVIALYYTAEMELPDETLSQHAALHLARFKQPRVFRRVDTLPRGTNGKLLRRQLRATSEESA